MKRVNRSHMLLAAVMGWSGMTMPAVAATIVQSGTNVTEIDNIVILGNTYNVTFGTTVDTTFNSSSLATTAADALRAVLNGDPTALTVGPTDFSFFVCSASSGPGSCDGDLAREQAGSWINAGIFTGHTVNVDNPVAKFALVGTPEPAAVGLAGFGLALLCLAKKRRAGRS